LPISVCGNNTVELSEECDDGNTISGDGCSATCFLEAVSSSSIATSSSTSSSSNVSSTPLCNDDYICDLDEIGGCDFATGVCACSDCHVDGSSSSVTSANNSSFSAASSESSADRSSSVAEDSSQSAANIVITASSAPPFDPLSHASSSESSADRSSAKFYAPLLDIGAAYRSQQLAIQQRLAEARQKQSSSITLVQPLPSNTPYFLPIDGQSHGAARLVDRNVLRGQGDRPTDLDLESPVNRAEAVTLLQRFFGFAGHNNQSPFPDVPTAQWYWPAVTAAARAGIVRGYEDGAFRPANNVTIAEIAQMIVIAAGWLPAGSELPGEFWYVPYLDEATRRGLFNGLPPLSASQVMLRGWLVQMLVNTRL
jgi:cysteine-rich repeat protein